MNLRIMVNKIMRFNSCDKSRKFKKIFLLMMAFLLTVSALTVAGCNDKNDDGGKATPTPTVTASATATVRPDLIKNGDFEETYDTSYPKTPKYWTSYGDSFGGSTYSLTSSANVYGIVNTEDEWETNSEESYGGVANPGTSDGSDEGDKNVIMVYNKKPGAAKYKSQSISLPANSYAKLSVYVKTYGIAPIQAGTDYMNYGASINLSGMDESVNINGIDTSENWVKYEFFIESSSSSSKTFYVEAGLGAGSPKNQLGYTSGWAFFDNVKLEYISKSDYENALIGQSLVEKDGTNAPVYNSDTDRFFYYDNDKYDDNTYTVNRIDIKEHSDWVISNCATFAYSYKNRPNITRVDFEDETLTALDVKGEYYSQVNPASFQTSKGLLPVTDSNYADALKNYPFTSANVYKLENANYATQGVKTSEYTVPAYSYSRIGLYVKTTDFLSNGLNIALIPSDSKLTPTLFSNVNTTGSDLSEEDLELDANLHNKWANWIEYVFYVQGSPYGETSFHIELWLGPDNVSGKPLSKFTKGWAMFSEINYQTLTSSEYSSATSGDTVKTGINLYETKSPQVANAGFNTSVTSQAGLISSMPVLPASWTGYFGGNKYLTGDKTDTLVANHNNGDVIKGIINGNSLAAYETNGYIDNTLTGLSSNGAPNYLMIRNVNASAYGFVTSSLKTLTENSYYKLTARLKTYGNAQANIYVTYEDGKIAAVDTSDMAFTDITQAVWTDYTMFIKTGELSKSVKIELWNGARDGSSLSSGYVLFDDIMLETSTEGNYNKDDESATLLKFDFTDIDVAPTATATATPEPTVTETPAPAPYQFPWALISTILLAAVLLFVLAAVWIRKFKKSRLLRRKTVKAVVPSYSRSKLKFNNKKADKTAETDNNEEDEDTDSGEETSQGEDKQDNDK